MKRFVAACHTCILALLISSLAIGATEIRKLGANDLEIGTGTTTSPGGKVVTRINGSNIVPDNTIPSAKLIDNSVLPGKLGTTGAAPTDNQALLYDNTTGRFKWGTAAGGSGGTTDNASLLTTGTLPVARLGDNTIGPEKLVTDNTGAWTAPGPVIVPLGTDNASSITGSRNASAVTCPSTGWMIYQASDNAMHLCVAGTDNLISLAPYTAPDTDNSTVYDFAGSTLDNSTFIYQVASTGTITQNNGVALSSGANATGEFLMAYRTEIVPTDNVTYKLDMSQSTGSSSNYFMRLEMQDNLATLAGHDDANYLVFGGIALAGNSTIYYRNNANAEIEGDVLANGTLVADTLYRWILETGPTAWRLRLVSINEGTEYLSTGWLNWSATKSTSGQHLWLITATEPYASATATVAVDRFEVIQ